MLQYYIIDAFLLLGCLVGLFFLIQAINEVIKNAREFKRIKDQ